MSDQVEVPFGDSAQDTAVLLLAAAEELDLDASVVRTGEGTFFAPSEVVEKAGLGSGDEATKAPAKKSKK